MGRMDYSSRYPGFNDEIYGNGLSKESIRELTKDSKPPTYNILKILFGKPPYTETGAYL